MRVRSFKIKILCFSMIVLLTIVTIFHMLGDEQIVKWTSIITIVSVILSPAVYFWKRYQDMKDEQDRVSRNLYEELNDALDGLDDEKYQINMVKITYKNKDYYFMNRDLNHDIYDSLVSSGKINFLPYKVQQTIQDIFKRIKQHNDYSTYIMRQYEKTNTIGAETIKYLKQIDSMGREIPKEICKIKEKFERDLL